MRYRVRFTTPEDVAQCATLSRDAPLLSLEESRQRTVLWRLWLQQGSATSVVIEELETESIVAFGLTVAVRDWAVELAREGERHLAACLLSERAVMDAQEVLRAHRGEGVHLVGFYGWQGEEVKSLDSEVHRMLLHSFLRLHRGLHLRSFTKEVYGKAEAQSYLDMGCTLWREPADFPPRSQWIQPYVVGADRETLATLQRRVTFLYDLFFYYHRPVVHLRRSQLILAQLAWLMEMSDEQIATLLGIGETAVLQRWCRLYDTIEQAQPEWNCHSANHKRQALLYLLSRKPQEAMPLCIGHLFYNTPQAAKQFSIPLP
ncbi:MAG: hypothetical protein KatS3mg023_1168 [Armatimonadota bacterium]|nr:MAG: hypothetical protein KatS3mg023_1168 [Armatimonadota bacterium]